jgi:hypothetical protein
MIKIVTILAADLVEGDAMVDANGVDTLIVTDLDESFDEVCFMPVDGYTGWRPQHLYWFRMDERIRVARELVG